MCALRADGVVAQAQVEALPILTPDRALALYSVTIVTS
jgi:hypothetical protein